MHEKYFRVGYAELAKTLILSEVSKIFSLG